jgi:hypothetical protein
VIGVKLPVSYDCFGETRIPGCQHVFLKDIRNNFCNVCGAQIQTIKNKYPQYDSINEFIDYLEKRLQKCDQNIIVAETTGFDHIEDAVIEDVVIGFGCKTDYDENFAHLPLPIARGVSFDEIRQTVKDALSETPELYDEKTFGLYAVLYYSS